MDNTNTVATFGFCLASAGLVAAHGAGLIGHRFNQFARTEARWAHAESLQYAHMGDIAQIEIGGRLRSDAMRHARGALHRMGLS